MGYQSQPWTLDEKESRVKKSNYIKNRESDKAISTARVFQIFEENKNKKFTNRDIAKYLGISESTISGITGKLRDLESIKQVGEIKPNRTIVYQHIDGPDSFKVMYNKIPTSQEIRNLFRNNTNKVYSSKLIAEETGYSSNIISSAMRVLLFNGTVKMVGTENGNVQYQYKTGNREGITVYTTGDKDYCSLNEFIEENNLKKAKEALKNKLDGRKSRFYYSAKGLVREYSKSYMAQVAKDLAKDSENKSFLGVPLNWMFS